MKMAWTRGADERKENTQENANTNNGRKTTQRKISNLMERPNQKIYRNESEKMGRNTIKQEVGQ